MAETHLILKQIRSDIGREPGVKKTLLALGLGRIGKQKKVPENKSVLGMIRKVEHLVKVDRLQ